MHKSELLHPKLVPYSKHSQFRQEHAVYLTTVGAIPWLTAVHKPPQAILPRRAPDKAHCQEGVCMKLIHTTFYNWACTSISAVLPPLFIIPISCRPPNLTQTDIWQPLDLLARLSHWRFVHKSSMALIGRSIQTRFSCKVCSEKKFYDCTKHTIAYDSPR